jgi:hypothetical protein
MNTMTVLKIILVTTFIWLMAFTNPASAQTNYVGPSSAGTADGTDFRDEDILAFLSTTSADEVLVYVSSTSDGNVDGIAFKDEDILVYNTLTDTWAMHFDGLG